LLTAIFLSLRATYDPGLRRSDGRVDRHRFPALGTKARRGRSWVEGVAVHTPGNRDMQVAT